MVPAKTNPKHFFSSCKIHVFMLHLATKLNENSTSSFTEFYKIMQIQMNKVDNKYNFFLSQDEETVYCVKNKRAAFT